MKYRVGLDVGTASVGVAAVSLDDKGQPDKLIWHHVRIFSEPVEKGKTGAVSKKAGRREARMKRVQIDRRASRLKSIADLSSLLGLNRKDVAMGNGNSLPYLRAKAATDKIELEDLLRVFLRMSKRRGYQGEFKAKKNGPVATGANELKDAMKSLAENNAAKNITLVGDAGVTIGQYLYQRIQSGLPSKLKVGQDEQKNLYALRGMVENEFKVIWNEQATHHPILNDDVIKNKFHAALFYQRPLKSPAGMVGQCGLEKTLPRAPRAQMAFQRFRIEKTLADLRWGAGKRAEPLSVAQKVIIRDLLEKNSEVKFTTIYNELNISGHAKPDGKGLNLDRASRDELLGNGTLAALRKLDEYNVKNNYPAVDLEEYFVKLDEKIQVSVINFLAELGSPEQLDNPNWSTSFVKCTTKNNGKFRVFNPEFIAFIDKIKDHEKFDRLSKMGFDGGRASYSVKALNTLTDWLKDPNWPGDWDITKDGPMGIDEESAVRACYPKNTSKTTSNDCPLTRLPAPDKTGDAVVDGSLRQIQWVINKMIGELGEPPTEIVVEMARDMSLGLSRRNDREKDINKQRNERLNAATEISEYTYPSPSKIRRYLLWVEQDHHCPYCEKIMSIKQALDGSISEFEHIIPTSLTQVGLKNSEIVLAHQGCNQEKGNRTPWGTWGHTDNWKYIEDAAKRLEKKKNFRKAKLLRLQDFEHEVLTDESVNGFADRQFHQTSWIAKASAQWLSCLCQVSVSRGELTSMLRRSWALETVIPEIRLESCLPILDDEGKPITVEEFSVLKRHLEGAPITSDDRKNNGTIDFSRRPDKRIDHRHHLIDAITIAMTSRRLFQKIAKTYKEEAEGIDRRNDESSEQHDKRIRSNSRLKIHSPKPPMKYLRDAALVAVRECQISVKSDRYASGALFQDGAYGITKDCEKLTIRKLVADLGKKDGKTSIESARKAINNILSENVKTIISDVFECRVSGGIKPSEALLMPITHPIHKTPIIKVLCTGPAGKEGVKIKFTSRQGDHYKYLINDSYAYMDISIDGSKSPILVKMCDTNNRNSIQEGMIRLFKGDTVLDIKNNKSYVIKQLLALDKGTLVMTLTTECRPVTEMLTKKELNKSYEKSFKDGLKNSKGSGLTKLKLI